MAFEASSNTAPNAKQIVFLFMAATVVAVVVFLCGVLVGRGVPVAGGLTTPDGSVGSMAVDLPPVTLSSPSSEPSAAASESSALTYYRRLNGGSSQPEVLDRESNPVSADAETPVGATVGQDASRDAPEPAATDVAPEPVVNTSDRPESVARLERPETPGTDTAPRVSAPDAQPVPPATDGYSLQVMALRSEDAAQDVVAQLVEQGYPARLFHPEPGAPALYRVRVGPFADRTEALRIQRRLETEGQFEPFLIR